ncbi:MAG TPA: HAMP domain-containing protein, partial [Solirubrobacteraceae bacterium]|nr:HAMP domain-containing protein [Solirubrobacteraceae bacterium]
MLDRIPVRWRLALTSSALTFVILCAFAVVVGQLTASRIRSDFNNELAAAVDDLSDRLFITNFVAGPPTTYDVAGPNLDDYAATNNAAIRILDPAGAVRASTKGAPNFGLNPGRSTQVGGYRVETRNRGIEVRTPDGRQTRLLIPLYVQYARPVSEIEHTVERVRLFLALGVLGGTLLALVAGLLVARRAMHPIAALTATSRRIAETRDPTARVPIPPGEDEIVELARTLDDMLASLDAAQEEREAMLVRQRQFVADASHELRTPLT